LTEDTPRLDLTQPRLLGALFSDSLRLYFKNFWRFLAIGAAVVVPVDLIVSGVGLGELTSHVDDTRPLAAEAIPLVVQALVTTPLVVAMTVYVLLDLADGRSPSLRSAIQKGLDAFAAIFLPVLIAVGCESLIGVALVLPLALNGSSLALIMLAVPLVLAVRWYFVAQSVVVDGQRRLGALRASWELTRLQGIRVFGIVLLGYLAFTTAAAIAGTPLVALARSADSGALVLAARIVVESLAAPALALLSALLYFDLKARRVAAA
jgi:hypothetical protein